MEYAFSYTLYTHVEKNEKEKEDVEHAYTYTPYKYVKANGKDKKNVEYAYTYTLYNDPQVEKRKTKRTWNMLTPTLLTVMSRRSRISM